MKTKNQFVGLTIFVMLLLNFSAKAQFQLINNHPDGCDVEISYEAWNNGCGICSFGVITIAVGMPVTIPATCNVNDLCVNVLTIGGVSQTANHTSMTGFCHAGQPNSATGSNPSGCNIISTSWTTGYTGSTWFIN